MKLTSHLGRGLAVGGAIAAVGAAGLTMTDRALAAAPDAPANAGATETRTFASEGAQNGLTVGVAPTATDPVESQIVVSGAESVIRDVDVRTFIEHTASGDLDIELESPEGTVVKLVVGNNGAVGSNDSFDGTLWDDSATELATDTTYPAPDGAVPELVPQGALGKFIGEDPNGTWILRVLDANDDADGGTLGSWQLALTTQATAPQLTATEHPSSIGTPLPVPDATDDGGTVTPGGVTHEIVVSGAKDYLWDANVVTDATHSVNVGDLRIRVTNPQGRTVVLSTNNNGGAGFYEDRLFDDSAAALVSTTASDTDPVVPEGALAALVGGNPNGTWTIEVLDSLVGDDQGSLAGWTLQLQSTDAATNGGGTPPPGTPPTTPTPPESTREVCLPQAPQPAPDRSKSGTVTVSTAQLRINQRIYQAAVRRANAVQKWLDAGLVKDDFCGGAIGAKQLGQGLTAGTLPAAQALTPPKPRPVVVEQGQTSSSARFQLTAAQLLINQRVAQAAVRRANGLEKRLDGGLTGGDIRDGQVSQDKLAERLTVTAAAPVAQPAASTTEIAARSGQGGTVRMTAGQLLVNQRIGQAAIRRLNALTARIESGITRSDVRAGSITAADLAPDLRK
ncbi:proprotein convertase P-domain-containing protein [Miltoncostaea marina]|uniref:proprotein convertase P-domain-containing protein n=1 Tax=Miltoncostaea marina TaxID=2843215 RepID=UPI001C3D4482|nr:proprotein convertase P-domain-containing protein [Miltoncostaea marina]